MSKLVSNINPAGKQKIFFCCHPEDFDKYYDVISRDLIAANDNSAIFHEAEPLSKYDEDELFLSLEQMNLFVIPVTASFLAGSSRACVVDLDFAIRKHIPVLPIAVESGIADSFNDSPLLGGLQYIDRTSTDSTEISYSEKLKIYLDSVLVSDKLAKRIREEFAASMFLSYRKKDRAHAQELMRRIRTIDFCRDVAIWYDEYLIPGESFEDHIKESLAASDAVLMNVTPSLLEKGNYVAEEEYPAAEELQKPVVAAETVRTSRFRLKSMYPDIGRKLVDGHNDAALRKALHAALVEKAGKRELLDPDSSAEHLYYIGLAYKNRIDVEADASKAVELLTYAYDKNWPAAALELARMYRNGDRLERDSDATLIWYDRYISMLEMTGEEGFDKEADLLSAGMEKAELQRLLGRFAEAEGTYKGCLERCRKLASEYGGFLEYIRLIQIYSLLGEMASACGNGYAAEEYAKGQLDACRWFIDNLDEIAFPESVTVDQAEANICYNQMFACQRLGDICRDRGEAEQAEWYYSEMLRTCDELAGTASGQKIESERLNQKAIGYDRLGDIRRVNGSFDEAGEYYQKAFEIRTKLAAAYDRTEFRRNLSMSHTRLGYIRNINGDQSAADHHYAQALEISEQLADGSNEVVLLDDLALAYYNYGLLKEDAAYYIKARDIWKKLYDQTGVGSYGERCETARAAIARIERPAAGPLEFTDDPEENEKLGDEAESRGEYEAAEQYYQEAFIRHAQQGDGAERAGDLNSAEKHYKGIVSVCGKSLAIRESDASRHNIAIGCERLGNIEISRNDPEKAKEYYLELVRMLEPVQETTDITDNRRELAVGYQRLSDVSDRLGNFDEAKAYILKAISIFEKYRDLSDEAGFRDDRSQCYLLLGQLCQRNDESDEALQYLAMAAAIKHGALY